MMMASFRVIILVLVSSQNLISILILREYLGLAGFLLTLFHGARSDFSNLSV